MKQMISFVPKGSIRYITIKNEKKNNNLGGSDPLFCFHFIPFVKARDAIHGSDLHDPSVLQVFQVATFTAAASRARNMGNLSQFLLCVIKIIYECVS